jgi:hypothetical protein
VSDLRDDISKTAVDPGPIVGWGEIIADSFLKRSGRPCRPDDERRRRTGFSGVDKNWRSILYRLDISTRIGHNIVGLLFSR